MKNILYVFNTNHSSTPKQHTKLRKELGRQKQKTISTNNSIHKTTYIIRQYNHLPILHSTNQTSFFPYKHIFRKNVKPILSIHEFTTYKQIKTRYKQWSINLAGNFRCDLVNRARYRVIAHKWRIICFKWPSNKIHKLYSFDLLGLC